MSNLRTASPLLVWLQVVVPKRVRSGFARITATAGSDDLELLAPGGEAPIRSPLHRRNKSTASVGAGSGEVLADRTVVRVTDATGAPVGKHKAPATGWWVLGSCKP